MATKNSSELAYELLLDALGRHQQTLTDEDKEIDEDEEIDLPWADNSFSTLEADPPWSYEDNGFNGFQSVQEYRIHCPYRTMRFRNILGAGKEVRRVMKPDSHCYLWTTKDFLMEALLCLRVWGYTFKNMLVWIKTSRAGNLTFGMGHWYRNGWEAMLFGTRGNLGRPAEATSQPNYFLAPKPPAFVVPDGKGGWTKHSRKPQEAYDLICRNSPGPRLSMFQRGSRDGFYCWGDEAEEGLQQEWTGDESDIDERLCFGVDYQDGLVSVCLDRNDVELIRLGLSRVDMEDDLKDRFDAISEVIGYTKENECERENYLNSESKGQGDEQDAQSYQDQLKKWKDGMSPEAWKEAVEKGWIDEQE